MLFLIFAGQPAKAEGVLRSSVSPEFMDGLHAKFLSHAAKQMGMELDILPMPFARRVLALRNGDIDIMLGLREGIETRGDFIYLEPSYEILKTGYFILKENYDKVNSEDDLSGLLLGASIVRSSAFTGSLLLEHGVQLVPVSTLQQKIDMLIKGRTDLFSHFIQSTRLVLEDRGLKNKIVLSKIQSHENIHYFFALSTLSPHFDKRHQFEKMLKEQVAKGAFIALCKSHYAVEQREKASQNLFCF
jgi:ABC-type amino acid transport substrate-binding protein